MEEYIELIDENNKEQCLELYKFLKTNCSMAKGSSNNHQYWEGGYFDHIKETFSYANKLYFLLNQDREVNFSLSDAILVLFLHDLEKPIKYSPLKEEYLNDDNEVKNQLINKFNIKLTLEHLLALKYIHGEGEDYRKDRRVMNELGAFCHCCDIISARIFFNYPK